MRQDHSSLIGARFERSVVLALAGKDSGRNWLCLCKCDCGNTFQTRVSNLKSSRVRSCGCLQKECARKIVTSLTSDQRKHKVKTGISRNPTGVSWCAMIQRCFNPKTKAYAAYGAVGIKPCEFIRLSQLNLESVIGPRTSVRVSLDRINNQLGYTCGSCAECARNGWPLNIRWASAKEQSRNKTNNRPVTINGVTRFARDWSIITGLSESTIRAHYLNKIRKRAPSHEIPTY